MPQSLCPFRRLLYQQMLARTRLYFQELREVRFAGDSEQVGTALKDYDLIEALAAVLDGYLLIGVYNDLERLAPSRVLYARHPKDFIPDLDDLFFADPPRQFQVKAEGKGRPSHRQAYVNYFKLFIRPDNLSQQNKTLDGAAAFFARHAFLEHVLETLTDNFQKNIKLAIDRLLADWNDVQRVFGLNPAANLRKIIPTGSDSHKGGKQVLIFEFSEEDNGQLRKLVYKPSDVEIDYRLIGNTREMPIATAIQGESLTEITNRMLADSNIKFAEDLWGDAFQAYTAMQKDAVSQRLRLPTYRILPRNPGSTLPVTNGRLDIQQSYGYLQFVTHDPVLRSPFSQGQQAKENEIVDLWENYGNSPEVRNQFDWITASQLDGEIFYRQWGQLMAMAHVVSLTDLHMQNQIVSRKKPTLIDLEVAFNAPGDSLARSGIIGSFQVKKDPDQHNALLVDASTEEFIPAALKLHEPDNKHPFNQLYCYCEEIAEEEDGNKNSSWAIWEQEVDHRDALYEGVHSLLAAYRNPANNRELRAWLKPLEKVVVRLVPRPTGDFIKALSDLVKKHSREKYLPGNDEQRWRLFAKDDAIPTNKKYAICRRLTDWWGKKWKPTTRFLNFPDPSPVLEHPAHNWRDLCQMDVPAYYRRIGERHLRDARGKVVYIHRAIADQYKWLLGQGVTLEPSPEPRQMLHAMLGVSSAPDAALLEEDEMKAFPAMIFKLTEDMFIHGYYFSETGIDQAKQRLEDLGRKSNQEFERHITAMMRKSFQTHPQEEREDILSKLFEGLSDSSNQVS